MLFKTRIAAFSYAYVNLETLLPDHLRQITMEDEGSRGGRFYVYSTSLLESKCLIEYIFEAPKGVFISIVTNDIQGSYRYLMHHSKELPSPLLLCQLVEALAGKMEKFFKLPGPMVDQLHKVAMGLATSKDEKTPALQQDRYKKECAALANIISLIEAKQRSSN